MKSRIQKKRQWFQIGFFVLFIFAPVFDLFRFDLNAGHFYFLTLHWTLGLEPFQQGLISSTEAAFNLITRGFIPLVLIVSVFIYVAWRWGRMYCGWLCPHYSVVELINQLMIRASGKPSLWEKNPLPELQAGGTRIKPNTLYWPITIVTVLLVSVLWAVALLTYLLPPQEIYSNLWNLQLTTNQFNFILVASCLFSIEFTFARHFFCRYGCAVGFFQSLAWMANRKAMVISYDKSQSQLCKTCNNACDNACPMRLKPRNIKRRVLTCTQCGECLTACAQQQGFDEKKSLIQWVQGDAALIQSEPPVEIPDRTRAG